MARGRGRSARAPRWKYAGTAGARRSVKADTVLPIAVPAPNRQPRPQPAPRPAGDERRPARRWIGTGPTMPIQTALAWTVLAIAAGATLSLLTRQPWVLGGAAAAVALLYLWRQLR
ncbi:MAG: hypothetical protein HY331_15075 [Chloroflexi bacterium]|nr:hypothetical protein [Chloroflexota bacterium]